MIMSKPHTSVCSSISCKLKATSVDVMYVQVKWCLHAYVRLCGLYKNHYAWNITQFQLYQSHHITAVDASNDNKKTNINSGRYKRSSMFAHVVPANEPHANSVNAYVSVTEYYYEKQTSKLVCYEIEVKLI